jgi:hypothetical protein
LSYRLRDPVIEMEIGRQRKREIFKNTQEILFIEHLANVRGNF